MTTQPRSLDESVQVSRRPNRGRAWLASVAIVGLAALVLAGSWWNSLRPENCYRRGRGALAAGDRMTVIREARRLIGNPGFEAQGRLLSGRLLLHDQRPADALPELQFAAHEPATAVDALTAAAECHYLLGQYLRAIEAGEKA